MTYESAQPEKPAGGSEIPAVSNPENALANEDHSTGNEAHDTGAAGGLPWYLAAKFEYRNNKSGPGRHLAPQESYVQDVLREGLAQQALFTPGSKSTELEQALEELGATRRLMEIRNEFDIDDDEAVAVKMEAKCILRDLRTRYLLALKIAGANHVDRMYRIRHAQLNDWDVNNTINSEAFINTGNSRDKWARKAGYYAFIIDNLAQDYNNAGIDLNLEGGIRQSLYSDARDAKQRLSQPAVAPSASDTADKADLSAMAA